MSQESGGCCCYHSRSTNKIFPVLPVEVSHRTVQVRPGRHVCVHYFNPYPREERFDKQMQEFINKAHTDEICTGIIPVFKKKREYNKVNSKHLKDSLNNTQACSSNTLFSNEKDESEIDEMKPDVQVLSQISSAEARPPVLSPSELTMLSLKDDGNNLEESAFAPLQDCSANIKYPNQTIFLLHGVGGSVDIWTAQTQYFTDLGYEVIVPEWIGHGLCPGSNNPKDFYFNEIVKDLALVFDLHCKKSNIIIGHSYGACFAAVLARTRPRLVQNLVMISGGAPCPLAPQSGLFKAPTCLLACLSPLLRHCLMQRAFYKNSEDSEVRKKAFGVSTSVIQNTMNGQLWPDGGTEYHNGITCPTLLIHGSEDQLISVEEELEMKQAIFWSELQVIEEASHMVMMEKPAVVNSLIQSLISGSSIQMHEPQASAKHFGSVESIESHPNPLSISKVEQQPHPIKLQVKFDSPASQRKSARSIPSRIFSAKKRS